jgi:hypothetical protein
MSDDPHASPAPPVAPAATLPALTAAATPLALLAPPVGDVSDVPAASQTLGDRIMEWSRPIIAVFGLAIFAMTFFIAWRNPETFKGAFEILVGAVVALVSTISGYYFGSSAGSLKKDAVIHDALRQRGGS